MDTKSLKLTSILLNICVAFSALYLLIGFKLHITSTLYGVFGNLLGGLFLLGAPTAVFLSFLWFKAENWRLTSQAFFSLLFSIGMLSLVFINPM